MWSGAGCPFRGSVEGLGTVELPQVADVVRRIRSALGGGLFVEFVA